MKNLEKREVRSDNVVR